MQRLRKLKGFTLIELIVVVIIIGILAAVAALAYNKFIGDARVNAAKATAKTVSTKLSSLAASDVVSDGDVAKYVKGLATPTALAGAVGTDATVLYMKDAAGAALTGADMTALVSGGSVFVGNAAHNCELKLTDTATIGACK